MNKETYQPRFSRIVAAAAALLVLSLPAWGTGAPQQAVTGTALYYSDKMQGHTVAMKGEKYDKDALTASTHSQFLLGSTVRVTNLSNQKSVEVKVNDRMNPKGKAVVDLSRKAAEEIDMIHAGHARVKVELVKEP